MQGGGENEYTICLICELFPFQSKLYSVFIFVPLIERFVTIFCRQFSKCSEITDNRSMRYNKMGVGDDKMRCRVVINNNAVK